MQVKCSCCKNHVIVIFIQDMSSRSVKLFQYTDWPEETGSVPSHASGLIDVIGQVQKWQINSGNMPIIVHCRYICKQTTLNRTIMMQTMQTTTTTNKLVICFVHV